MCRHTYVQTATRPQHCCQDHASFAITYSRVRTVPFMWTLPTSLLPIKLEIATAPRSPILECSDANNIWTGDLHCAHTWSMSTCTARRVRGTSCIPNGKWYIVNRMVLWINFNYIIFGKQEKAGRIIKQPISMQLPTRTKVLRQAWRFLLGQKGKVVHLVRFAGGKIIANCTKHLICVLRSSVVRLE